MYYSAIWLKPGVAIAGKQRLAVFPDALVRVHAAAVVREKRLGHERHGLAVLVGHVADDVLVQHHVVGRLHQRVEALIDLALAAGGHFMVMALDDAGRTCSMVCTISLRRSW